MRKITLIILLICSIKVNAQLRQFYLDATNNNEILKTSFYTPANGYVAFTNCIGFSADSGRSYTKKYITNSNVNFNGNAVNLTFGFGIAGVKAFNKDTIIVYGDYAFVPSILYSTDQGSTFKLVYYSQYDALRFDSKIADINFPTSGNLKVGFAVDADRILRTSNKGLTWSVIGVLPKRYFTAIESVSSTKLYFKPSNPAFSKIYRYEFATLDSITVPVGAMNYMWFNTSYIGWCNVDNGVYVTYDRGQSWKLMNNLKTTPFNCKKMRFINDSTGYALAGLYDIYKTTDSGKIWQPLPRDNHYIDAYHTNNDLQFMSDNQFWSGGYNELLQLTTNGGGNPIPKAFFDIDSTGFSATNKIKLINYSRPNYQYQWLVNNSLVSTNYNYIYTHTLNTNFDEIKLVVSNGTYTDTLIKKQYFKVNTVNYQAYTGWQLLPTGINDNLLDVRILGNNGFIIADGGLYYSINGLDSIPTWKKYAIPNNSNDSLLLTKVKFKQMTFDERTPVFYFCGNDTVNNKAVLFKVNMLNNTDTFLYKGNIGSHFNAIEITDIVYFYDLGIVQAIGDSGLYVIYDVQNNKVDTPYFDKNVSIKYLFSRPNHNLPENVGIISDSIGYIGNWSNNYGVSIKYKNNVGYKMKQGTVGQGQYDFFITDSLLYRTFIVNNLVDKYLFNFKKGQNLKYNTIETSINDGKIFVGTNKGIYKLYIPSVNWEDGECLEYQPTSLGKHINKIWFREQYKYDTGYAVGNNGVLFKTINGGGPTVPYSNIMTSELCFKDSIEDLWIGGRCGTGSSVEWYIDNSFIGNDILFSIPLKKGTHSIMKIVGNIYGLFDTSYQTINIISKPTVRVSSTNNTFCNNGITTFKANTSDLDSIYSYQWYKNSFAIGNSSSVYVDSNIVNGDSMWCVIYCKNLCSSYGNIKSNIVIVSIDTSARFITGNLRTSGGKLIKNIKVKTTGTITDTLITSNKYLFSCLNSSGNYTIRPTKNNDITKANGINTTDVLFVQRHILNTTKLNSAYKLIAADVNGDKVVNATDLLRIKRLILGTDTTFTKGSGVNKVDRLWEFVDSAYQFPDTANPFPFKDSISFTNLTSNKINQTFIGVKLGDVNDSWNPAVAKSVQAKPVELEYTISNKQLTKTNEELGIGNSVVRIPITVNNYKELVAMQYTLHFDNTKYEFVNLEGFKNLQGFDYNTSQANTNGNISFIWTDKNAVERTLEDGTELFVFVLQSTVDSRPSTDLQLTIDNSITDIAAWDKNFNRHSIILTKREITTNKSPLTTNQWSVNPNPTSGEIKVSILSKVNKTVSFELTDAQGKTILKQAIELQKGSNSFTLNLKQNGNLATGIYFLKAVGVEGDNMKRIMVK